MSCGSMKGMMRWKVARKNGRLPDCGSILAKIWHFEKPIIRPIKVVGNISCSVWCARMSEKAGVFG